MNWHCIRLTRQAYAAGELEILRSVFRAAYVARNGPRGMALYGYWSEDGLTYLVYASPTASRYLRPILTAYSAKAETPPPQPLRYICGDEAGNATLLC